MTAVSRVLVLNARYKHTLAAIRSLGRRNLEIVAADHTPWAMSFFSKYTMKRCLYRSPKRDMRGFVLDVVSIAERENVGVIMPIGVDTSVPLSLYKPLVEKYARMVIADYKSLIVAHDKALAVKLAERLGVPVPRTIVPRSLKEVKEVARELEYPVVIKRRRGSGAREGVRYARNPRELVVKYRELSRRPAEGIIEDFSRPMIQEYVPGEIRDVCTIFRRGELRGIVVQRRVWTWPREGGPGILNETIRDPRLAEYAVRLLRALKWHGPAQVEFKLDADGRPRLMEINPKFWGTLELSIKAGVDFPYMYYRIAVEGDVEPVSRYREGLYILWPFPHDVEYLLSSPAPLEDLRFLLTLLLENRGKIVSDVSLSDPGPEAYKLKITVRAMLRALISRTGGVRLERW